MGTVSIDEGSLRTLLQIAQNGPGEPTPSARDQAIYDALGALLGNSPVNDDPDQPQLPGVDWSQYTEEE